MKLKKGDTVTVVSGKDKGKTNTIEKVFAKENLVLVLNVNEYKRHIKANPSGGQKSEIRVITKPLPVSNVMFVCPKCKQMARLGYTMQGDKKARICRNCKESV